MFLQVKALMAEKQHLACRCSGLERENEQLAELVGHLNVALEDQQEREQDQEQQDQVCDIHDDRAADAAGDEEPSLPLAQPPAAAGSTCGGGGCGWEQHQRVAEWLQHEQPPLLPPQPPQLQQHSGSQSSQGWIEWQEQLVHTLEPMGSGSSTVLDVAAAGPQGAAAAAAATAVRKRHATVSAPVTTTTAITISG